MAIQAMVIGDFDDAAMLGVAAATLASAAAPATANTAKRRFFTSFSPYRLGAPSGRAGASNVSIV
ncbi:MAG TPA: hypothetical protein VHU17_14665 [Acidimicrobiales bacterium]|nr:hypothetical protein [Acidimicrobiales bacterium]